MELLRDERRETAQEGTRHFRIYRDVVADDQGLLYDAAIEFVTTGELPSVESHPGSRGMHIPFGARDLDSKGVVATRGMNPNGGIIIEFHHPKSGRAARVDNSTGWTGKGWFSYVEARTGGRFSVQDIQLSEGLAQPVFNQPWD